MHAIVLVGGEGRRLRSLTDDMPKPLIPVGGRPVLHRLLDLLARHGISDVTLAMTKRSAAAHDSVGDEWQGMVVHYAYDEPPLGSGGAIEGIAAGWAEPFFVLNGDIVTDLDLRAMRAAHEAAGAELTISLHEVHDPTAYGIVDLAPDGRIKCFVEKPSAADAPSRLANSGVWLFDPALVREIPAGRLNRVEDELFPVLAAAGRPIHGFCHTGLWFDIGTPETYREAEQALSESGEGT